MVFKRMGREPAARALLLIELDAPMHFLVDSIKLAYDCITFFFVRGFFSYLKLFYHEKLC